MVQEVLEGVQRMWRLWRRVGGDVGAEGGRRSMRPEGVMGSGLCLLSWRTRQWSRCNCSAFYSPGSGRSSAPPRYQRLQGQQHEICDRFLFVSQVVMRSRASLGSDSPPRFLSSRSSIIQAPAPVFGCKPQVQQGKPQKGRNQECKKVPPSVNFSCINSLNSN